jgi:hypothetical protein
MWCAVFWDATLFCNNFARWLQKRVACEAMCRRMCWFFWDATFFCNNFARWLQKRVATFDVLFFGDATLYCNNFAQKRVATCDVLFFWDATLYCNNFARWLQKRVATRPRNPRFKDAHAGTKRRLKAKTINRDSGISGTGSNHCGEQKKSHFHASEKKGMKM